MTQPQTKSTSPINQNVSLWVHEMAGCIKKDHDLFNRKRLIREYLKKQLSTY